MTQQRRNLSHPHSMWLDSWLQAHNSSTISIDFETDHSFSLKCSVRLWCSIAIIIYVRMWHFPPKAAPGHHYHRYHTQNFPHSYPTICSISHTQYLLGVMIQVMKTYESSSLMFIGSHRSKHTRLLFILRDTYANLWGGCPKCVSAKSCLAFQAT